MNWLNGIGCKFEEAYNNAIKEKSGGGDYYRTAANRLDHNFLFCLAESVNTGKTTYTEAYGLTNTNRKTYTSLTLDSDDFSTTFTSSTTLCA